MRRAAKGLPMENSVKSTGTVWSWDSGSDLLGNVVSNLIKTTPYLRINPALIPPPASLLLPPHTVYGMRPLPLSSLFLLCHPFCQHQQTITCW